MSLIKSQTRMVKKTGIVAVASYLPEMTKIPTARILDVCFFNRQEVLIKGGGGRMITW